MGRFVDLVWSDSINVMRTPGLGTFPPNDLPVFFSCPFEIKSDTSCEISIASASIVFIAH